MTATSDTVPEPAAPDGSGGQVARPQLDIKPGRGARHGNRNHWACRQDVRLPPSLSFEDRD